MKLHKLLLSSVLLLLVAAKCNTPYPEYYPQCTILKPGLIADENGEIQAFNRCMCYDPFMCNDENNGEDCGYYIADCTGHLSTTVENTEKYRRAWYDQFKNCKTK
jgi:hypothetical protein